MVEDFGGPVRSSFGEETRMSARSRLLVVLLAFVGGALVVLAASFFWGDEKDDEQELAASGPDTGAIAPTLDPEGQAADLYAGSAWERRANLKTELVNIFKSKGADGMDDARLYVDSIEQTLLALCGETQKLLEFNPGKWAAVLGIHAATMDEISRQAVEAVTTFDDHDRLQAQGLFEHFDCR